MLPRIQGLRTAAGPPQGCPEPDLGFPLLRSWPSQQVEPGNAPSPPWVEEEEKEEDGEPALSRLSPAPSRGPPSESLITGFSGQIRRYSGQCLHRGSPGHCRNSRCLSTPTSPNLPTAGGPLPPRSQPGVASPGTFELEWMDTGGVRAGPHPRGGFGVSGEAAPPSPAWLPGASFLGWGQGPASQHRWGDFCALKLLPRSETRHV